MRAGTLDVGAAFTAGAALRGGRDGAGRYVIVRSIGYLLTDHLTVGIGLGLAGDFADVPGSAWTGDLVLHGPLRHGIAPFLGIQGGTWADILRSRPRLDGMFGSQAGLKIFVSDTLAINAGGGYMARAHEPGRGFVVGTLGVSMYRDWKR